MIFSGCRAVALARWTLDRFNKACAPIEGSLDEFLWLMCGCAVVFGTDFVARSAEVMVARPQHCWDCVGVFDPNMAVDAAIDLSVGFVRKF